MKINKYDYSSYQKNLQTSSRIGGGISFPFYFLFPVRFPHEVPEGPSRSALDFPDGLTRNCLAIGKAYSYGGTYDAVSSMINVGYAVATLD